MWCGIEFGKGLFPCIFVSELMILFKSTMKKGDCIVGRIVGISDSHHVIDLRMKYQTTKDVCLKVVNRSFNAICTSGERI